MAGQGSEGNQVFVTVRKGKEPPRTVDIRVKYEQQVSDIKRKAASELGVPLDKLELFFQGRELVAETHDNKTLLEMGLHTGFGLMGYDLREQPDYWPPVKETPEGKQFVGAQEH